MKTILKVIGFLVLVVVLAAVVLYYLNNNGYLSGDLSEWINNMSGHVSAMFNETKEFAEESGILSPAPTPADTPVEQATPAVAPAETAEPVAAP